MFKRTNVDTYWDKATKEYKLKSSLTRKELFELLETEKVEIREHTYLVHKNNLTPEQKKQIKNHLYTEVGLHFNFGDKYTQCYWVVENNELPYPVHMDNFISTFSRKGYGVYKYDGKAVEYFVGSVKYITDAIQLVKQEYSKLSKKQQSVYEFAVVDYSIGYLDEYYFTIYEQFIEVINNDNIENY